MKGLLLVLLASVAFASCHPTLGLIGGIVGGGGGVGGAKGLLSVIPFVGGPIGGGRPGGRTDRGFVQTGRVYPVGGGGIWQALAFLSQGLTDIAGNAGSILDDVVHLRIPAILDDGFNAVISVGRASGGIINAFIPGLGSLFGNLVVAIGKIFICLAGSPGLTGGIIGDRRPGRDNPRDIPYICGSQYGKSWGCGYDGPYDNDVSIINHYHTKDSYRQAQEYINKCTNGAGIESLTGSRKIIVIRILAIAKIFDKGSRNWGDDDIFAVVINIIIINAAIGDSYQPGLGVRIVDEWITNLRKNKNKRFPDISKHRVDIIAALKGTREDKFAGAFNQAKRREWEKIRKSDTQSNDEISREIDTSNRNNNKSGRDGTEDLRIRDASQNTSKNTDKSSNTKSSSGSGIIEKRADGSTVEAYNYNDAEANGRERTAETTDTREHNLSRTRGADSGTNRHGRDSSDGTEDRRVRDASQNTSKNTDKSSNAKSSSGSGSIEKRADGGTVEAYNYNDAEANGRERTAETTDTREHNLSRTRGADSGTNRHGRDSSDGTEDRRVRDASQNTSKNTDKSSNAKSSSGSGSIEKRADGGTVEAYNYNDAEANGRERTAETTDTREHNLSRTRGADSGTNRHGRDSSDGTEDRRVRDASQNTSKNTDKSSNAKSSSGSGSIEKRADGGTVEAYNYNDAEANGRERTAETTDTREHNLSRTRGADSGTNRHGRDSSDGTEDRRVRDASQNTSKNTDKSSNAKSSSGSGSIEKRADGGTVEAYNYNDAEANGRERTAETTDTREHNLSRTRGADSGTNRHGRESSDGTEDRRVRDASQNTSKNTDKSSNAKSSSGSGSIEKRADGGTVEAYNYNDAEANGRERTAETTDTREHNLSRTRGADSGTNGHGRDSSDGTEDRRVRDASQNTSKNTDKSSNAKSSSGSGSIEKRADGGTVEAYNYNNAEANGRERTAETTDTREHNLSRTRGADDC